MSKVTIELTEKVVFEFMERGYKGMDTEHLPYKDFTIEFPLEVFLSKDQVFTDTARRMKENGVDISSNKQLDKIEGFAEKYVKKPMSIRFKQGIVHTTITVLDSYNNKLFEFTMLDILPFPNVTFNEFARDELAFSLKILTLISHTIDYIQQPRKEVLVSQKRETKKKKGSKKKSGGKTYIYKKIYKVLDVESSIEKREYNRIRESWRVKGHWRHYKSGKTVWIEEHTRGNKEKQPESQEFKVTRLD